MIKNLNATQAEAVTFDAGPLLILAGAGSGKTRVLTARIAWLVNERRVPPSGILAVTFTNKAAGEMKERLHALIGDKADSLWLGTFHSLGLRFLRKEAARAGTSPYLTVYDEDDQVSIMKEAMAELGMNDKSLSPKAVAARINAAKNEEVGPREFALHARDFLSERVAKVYSLYQKKLKDMNAADFGDLICEPIRLLRENPGLLGEYQERFGHVLVDEYQDTNRAQYNLTNLLAGGSRNIFAVGDPDQSIYAWRGADIRNILDFSGDYPDATVIRLEQNYRSTKRILAAANSVIEKNENRPEKTLWTENREGADIVYEEATDEYDEARKVVRRLKELLDTERSLSYGGSAVFYRTNAQSRVFEETLMREGIPYSIVGGVRFYDRKEIRDAIAYLRVAANPGDGVSLARIINTPPRGVGKVTLDRIKEIAREEGLPAFTALKEALSRGLLKKSRIKDFIEAYASFARDAGSASLGERATRLLEDAGYMLMWHEEASEEAAERIENIFELVSAIKDFEAANIGSGLPDFLDHVALISDTDSLDSRTDRLTLMTLHSAKGLEFKAVMLTGMEEGLFPHSRSADDPAGIEEERRLCYVGMTRAMERLCLFSAASRTVYGERKARCRSRFIDEIDPSLITIVERERERAKTVFTEEAHRDCDEDSAPVRGYAFSGRTHQSGPIEGLDAPPASSAWKVGMKVVHPNFGVGVITERSGSGLDEKLTVSFKDHGKKKLVVRYAPLSPA